MSDQFKYTLSEADIPTTYYNIAADLPKPVPPPLHPGTHQPIGPDDLAPLFPMALILQEVSTERYIEIPEPVRDVFRLWRPSPLVRAHRLEKVKVPSAKEWDQVGKQVRKNAEEQTLKVLGRLNIATKKDVDSVVKEVKKLRKDVNNLLKPAQPKKAAGKKKAEA